MHDERRARQRPELHLGDGATDGVLEQTHNGCMNWSWLSCRFVSTKAAVYPLPLKGEGRVGVRDKLNTM